MRANLSELCELFLTRLTGERVRKLLREKLDAVQSEDILEVDLAGVSNMTPSFADECFGKLIQDIGKGTFAKRLRLLNGSPAIKGVINTVLSNRLAQVASEPDSTPSA